jgi:hypothetical protein
MSVDHALGMLRTQDPARLLEPLSHERREALRDEVLASARRVARPPRARAPRLKALQLAAILAAALVVGVGVAWAAGALTPLAVFENNRQSDGSAPGSLWDQHVVPSSVVDAGTVDLPNIGTVAFWYGRSKEGGWCGALQLPSGDWIATNKDPLDGGGTLPGCFPSRELVNKSATKPVYVINGFDYQEGDVDARASGGPFWRIRYGEIDIDGAARVTDLVTDRSAPVVHGHLFALAIPDEHPTTMTEVHLVAYDQSGKVVGDDCPSCQP